MMKRINDNKKVSLFGNVKDTITNLTVKVDNTFDVKIALFDFHPLSLYSNHHCTLKRYNYY